MPGKLATMTARLKSPFCLYVLPLLFPFLMISCSQLNPFEREIEVSATASPEAAADATLGSLPGKGKGEAAKQVTVIEGEDEERKVYKETQRTQQQEETQKAQRSVTEDQILEQQIRRT